MTLFAVNSGGTALTSQDDVQYSGDHYFSGGNISNTGDTISNTQDQDLFNTERWGEFDYRFPVKPGAYDVTLHFAETWFGPSQTGNRVFDVQIEGETYIDDLDPLEVAGHDVAHTIEVKNVNVNDEHLDLSFVGSVDQASLRGIVVKGLLGNARDEEPEPNGSEGSTQIPSDCPQTPETSADQFIVFDGITDLGSISGGTLELHGGWMLDEVWAVPEGANIELVDTNDGVAIEYGNARQFTGFKFTPPLNFGQRQEFGLSGIDLYIEGSSNSAQFGLRVIKPGEDEGNGNASTTTWVRNSQGQQDLNLSQSCSHLSLDMPSNWNSEADKANRFILEVKNNWNNSSSLKVRRLVIKGYNP